MNAKTLKALKGSIAKWEAIVAGAGDERGGANCPLCHLFADDICRACPVAMSVGATQCDRTPYDEWRRVTDGGGGALEPKVADTIEKVNAARAELAFLKSLLPRKRK